MSGAIHRVLPVIAALAVVLTTPNAARSEGSVVLQVFDRLGRAFPVIAVLRGADGKEFARSPAPGEPVKGPAGKWILSTPEDPALAGTVELTDTTNAHMHFTEAGAVWVQFASFGNKRPYRVLLKLRSREALASILPRLRLPRAARAARSAFALPRPEAAAAARATAVQAARAELAKPRALDEPSNERTAVALRIIDAIGEAADDTTVVPETGMRNLEQWDVAAHLEARLGILDRGKLVDVVRAGGPHAALAASSLHTAGLDIGDRALLAATADGESPYLFQYLLDVRPDAARPAMLALAAKYAARAREIAAGSADKTNAYEQGRLPAILYLMTYGPDDALKALLDTPLSGGDDNVLALAAMAADPGQLADVLMSRLDMTNRPDSGSDNELDLYSRGSVSAARLARLCTVTSGLSAESANKFWNGLYDRISAAAWAWRASVLPQEAAPQTQRDAFAKRIAGVFFTFLAPCHHSSWPLDAYAAYNCKRGPCSYWGYLPRVDWLPHYWLEEERIALLAKEFSVVPTDGGLDLIAPDRFEELIAKRGPLAPSPLLDLYRAYHRVAARTGGAYPDVDVRLADDTERRLYLIGRDGQPAQYDTFLEGWADLRPELADGRLHLHLRLDQLASHQTHNMYDQFSTYPLDGGERYVVDNGRALIGAVKLWHGAEPVELKSLGTDGQGGFIYEAKAASLDGLVAEVDLDLFGDRRQLVYDLANGDYAVRLRRAGVARREK